MSDLKGSRPRVLRTIEAEGCDEGHIHACFAVAFGDVLFDDKDDCILVMERNEGKDNASCYLYLGERLKQYVAQDHRLEHLLQIAISQHLDKALKKNIS